MVVLQGRNNSNFKKPGPGRCGQIGKTNESGRAIPADRPVQQRASGICWDRGPRGPCREPWGVLLQHVVSILLAGTELELESTIRYGRLVRKRRQPISMQTTTSSAHAVANFSVLSRPPFTPRTSPSKCVFSYSSRSEGIGLPATWIIAREHASPPSPADWISSN